ncbi:MAG: hypothetical protein ACYC46_07725 [Acidobacteriaceae bacterium]
MLTILYPQLVPYIEGLSIGLSPLHFRTEPDPRLVIKAPKECLLTAKINQGFKVYVVPISLVGQDSIGLISAFFDDEDEPLVIYTPVFEDEEERKLVDMLQRASLDIHFFDEHSREWLGYSCEVNCPPDARQRLLGSSLLPFDLDLAKSAHTQMKQWFGSRTSEDDLAAISVRFQESRFPDDLVILDARVGSHLFPGSPSFSHSQLDREEPGAFQERDIAHLLARLFEPAEILMNPLRTTDKEEVSDILLLTDSEIMVLQAKDSPNTERVLRNTVARKKLTAEKSLLKAISQVKGALRYLRLMSPAKLIVSGELTEVEIGDRDVRALIVVKELFDDEYSVYSPPIINLSKETGVPCIALDYPELQAYTGMSSREKFFEAFDLVYAHAQETGQLPRLRIWNVDDDESQ